MSTDVNDLKRAIEEYETREFIHGSLLFLSLICRLIVCTAKVVIQLAEREEK